MNINLSEIELVEAFNRKDPAALRQLNTTYFKALSFLTRQLIGEKNTGDIVYQSFSSFWKSEKHFTSYQQLIDFLYIQVVEVVINAAKDTPFGMFEIIKIEKEANAEIVHAEFLRILELNHQTTK